MEIAEAGNGLFFQTKKGVTKEPDFAHRLMLKLARFIRCSYLSGLSRLRRAAFICIREFRFGNWVAFCTKVQYSDKKLYHIHRLAGFQVSFYFCTLYLHSSFFKAQQYNSHFYHVLFKGCFTRFYFNKKVTLFPLKNLVCYESAASSKTTKNASACAFAERSDRISRLDGRRLRLRVAPHRGTGAWSGHCIPEQK